MESNSTELELLVKRITAQVVDKLMKSQQDSLSKILDVHMPESKYMLVLIPEFIVDLQAYVDYLDERYPNYERVYGISGSFNIPDLKQASEIINISDESSRQKLLGMMNKFDAAFVLSPGIMQLKAIADGDDTGFIEKIIMYHILHSRHAGVIIDYDVRSMPSNILADKLGKLLGSLKSMGLSVETAGGQPVQDVTKVSKKGRRLIAEKDIDEMHRNGIKTINAGSESIITPLAKDRASELNMLII